MGPARPYKRKRYTAPVICDHGNDTSKDWYVFFCYKSDGKVHKFKKREGINRIKDLAKRTTAIENLLMEIEFDLRHGWDPLNDPKREIDYNPYLHTTEKTTKTAKQHQAYIKFFTK